MKLNLAIVILSALVHVKKAAGGISIGTGKPVNYSGCTFVEVDKTADAITAAGGGVTVFTAANCETACTITNAQAYAYFDDPATSGAADQCKCFTEADAKCEATPDGTASYGELFCLGTLGDAASTCRQPSSQPSSMPSSQPSQMPSSIPSEAPSGQPSSIPSEAPSSIPSESPSMHPSEHPSESPSCTPSSAPTTAETTYQYYADWSPSGNGCKNDGNQPNYMAANPTNYLYSTLDKCCSTHFGWNYLACMGQLDNVCARSLWYPDWSGADEGCLDDGNEPSYMTENPTYYMFASKVECCEQHYNWKYVECVGTKTSANKGLYYPDFDSSDHVCRNDGQQPMYMDQSPEWWMHKDLKECCATNYSWNYEECIGSDPNATPVANPDTDGKYFPDWLGSEQMCKNDGTQPPYMSKNPDMWMYDTLDECCKARYSWKYDSCRGATGATNGTGQWVKNFAGDCREVGTIDSSDYNSNANTYDTKKACCKNEKWWDDDCETS